MRVIVAAVVIAAGVGFLGVAAGAAMPGGAALERAASSNSLLSQVRYFHWHGHACYRKCYREYLVGPRVCRTFC